MAFQVLNILHILIIAQSFLFAFVLFTQKSAKRRSNGILATFLLLLGLQMLIHLLKDKGVHYNWLWGLRGMVFAYGPLMYFYTKSLTNSSFQFKPIDIGHFIPALIFIFISSSMPNWMPKLAWLLYVSMGIYLYLSFRLIWHFRQIVLQAYSEFNRTNLSWLQWSIGLLTLVVFADLLSYFLNQLFPGTWIDQNFDFVVLGMVLFFVNTIVYKGFRYPVIFSGFEEAGVFVNKRKNALAFTPSHQILIDRLERMMQQEKPYLAPTLTIKELAQQLKVPIRQLSEAINHYYQQNFSEFINAYRIEMAKERLKNPKDPKETVLEVMYEVGFNSKSSFNTLFKKSTGLTPTEYKRKL